LPCHLTVEQRVQGLDTKHMRNVATSSPAQCDLQTTVAEALWFSCRLRFTSDIDNVTARAFVDEVTPPLFPF